MQGTTPWGGLAVLQVVQAVAQGKRLELDPGWPQPVKRYACEIQALQALAPAGRAGPLLVCVCVGNRLLVHCWAQDSSQRPKAATVETALAGACRSMVRPRAIRHGAARYDVVPRDGPVR
jgi:hypothetical protein